MSLYLVSTPIGNLADITQRAIATLQQATIIAAEDTRSARRLLAALNLSAQGKQLVSYGEHNEAAMAPLLAEQLQAGAEVALISEGGTPLVSDPGYRLVQAALAGGVPVIPVPGPSALLAALAGSGLPVHGFVFRGFLPKKPGARRRVLEALRDREETLIFYEAPQRVARVLAELVQVFGPERPACLARELTKVHETFVRLPLGQLALQAAQEPPRGECTLLVAGVKQTAAADAEARERPGENVPEAPP